jgi:hypothetical protein
MEGRIKKKRHVVENIKGRKTTNEKARATKQKDRKNKLRTERTKEKDAKSKHRATAVNLSLRYCLFFSIR